MGQLSEIAFDISFEPEPNDRDNERPLDKALRLVREELARVESRNQLQHYLKEFNVSVRPCFSDLQLKIA